MEDRPTTLKVRNRVRNVNRRLAKNNADPRNADRALWGELTVGSFASLTGLSRDVQIDPETVLGDLLADLMHWCDVQKNSDRLIESLDFESALRRARDHYSEECADELEQEGWVILFDRSISAKLRAEVFDRNGFTCQSCGLSPGDIDPYTGRKVRLHVGHIKDKNLGGKDELSNLRALCSTCNQGAKNITGEKPTSIWLLSQIRRAGIYEQRAVFNWLLRKFAAKK